MSIFFCCCRRIESNKKKVIPVIPNNNSKRRKSLIGFGFNQKLIENNIIGDGAYSTVYKVTINNKEYACKSVITRSVEYFHNEIKILEKISDYTYLPKLYEYKISKKRLFIIMDLIQGKELFYVVKHHMLLKRINYIIFQIIQGVKHLHENNIYHLDLKLENVMIDNNDNIKIIDFGLSKILSPNNNGYIKLKHTTGSLGYFPPEMVSPSLIFATNKTDIWNIGVILWMLLSGKPAFTVSPHTTYLKEIKNPTMYGPISKYYGNFFNINVTDDYKFMYYDIIERTITLHYKRYTIHQLSEHQLFID